MSDRWVVFDVETTGLLLPSAAKKETQPRIVEIGIVILQAGNVVQEASFLLNPEQPISPEITKITGLRDEDVAHKSTFAAQLNAIVELFLGARGWAAHNLPFDRGMLVAELARIGLEYAFPYPPEQLCTVAAYHHLKGRNMKLTELYEHILGRKLAQTHRALDDARALAEILIAEALA